MEEGIVEVEQTNEKPQAPCSYANIAGIKPMGNGLRILQPLSQNIHQTYPKHDKPTKNISFRTAKNIESSESSKDIPADIELSIYGVDKDSTFMEAIYR